MTHLRTRLNRLSHCRNGRETITFHRYQVRRSFGRGPNDAMSIATLNDIFFAAVERNLDRMQLYREAGKWLPISSRQFGQNVARVARALHSWGIRGGDRVAILSENRPEWSTVDMASLLLGAVTVPLYTTLTEEQTAFALNDSGCRMIFVSSDQQLHKVVAVLRPDPVSKKSLSWTRSSSRAILRRLKKRA